MADRKPTSLPLTESSELERLLDAVTCDEITCDETTRLNAMLTDSKELRSRFITRMFDDALLADQLVSRAEEIKLSDEAAAIIELEKQFVGHVGGLATPASNGGSRGRAMEGFSRTAKLGPNVIRNLAALAASVLIGAVLGYSTSSFRQQDVVAKSESDEPRPITMVSATGCVWDELSKSRPTVGTSLKSGDSINLLEGIAEFELGDGETGTVLVRLEGPTQIEVGEDHHLQIDEGNLTLDATARLSPVQIATPLGQLEVAASSHIGLFVSKGSTVAHAFVGQIRVAGGEGHGDEPLAVIRDGEAASFESIAGEAPRVSMFEADPSAFASMHSMSADKLGIGEAYASAVLDAHPDVYWRFEPNEANERVVPNLGSSPNMSGQIKGSVSWRKHGPNTAIEFGQTFKPGHVISEGSWPAEPLDSYSIELWLKPSHPHDSAVVGLVGETLPDGRASHGVLIATAGPTHAPFNKVRSGSLRFLHRFPPSVNASEGSACTSLQQYSTREWQHVVATKTQDRHRLYIDGIMRAVAIDESALTANLGLIVGVLYDTKLERPFIGQIDELAFYSRALTEDEIRRHHELGRAVSVRPESY